MSRRRLRANADMGAAITTRRLVFAAAGALALASCDSTDLASVSVEPSGLGLEAPPVLTRAVDSDVLYAEIDLTYTVGSETVSRTETASRTGGTDTWNVALVMPANAEVTLDITWYDTMDAPRRADLTTLTRNFSTGEPGSRLTLVFPFSEYDSDAFDTDSDNITNLVERQNGTSPFSPDTTDDPPPVPPLIVEEDASHTVSIADSAAGASTAVAWRWSDGPVDAGVLEACRGANGFDAPLAASSLESACTDPDGCAVTFDQLESGTQQGEAALFSMTVPRLRASVGVTYRLEALDRTEQSTATSRTFCLIAINEAPVAADDRFTVTPGVPLTVTAEDGANLLSNDTDDIDVSNEPLTVDTTPVRAPARAAAFSLLADGGFTYEADPGTAGGPDARDSFEYAVGDGTFTDTATVTLDIVAVDRPPVLTSEIPAQSVVVGIETSVDLSGSFSDPENAELAFGVAEGTLPPSDGLAITETGVLSGTAQPGDEGTYSVTIEARDRLSAATGILALEVRENQRPVAGPIPDITSAESGEIISVDASQSFSDPEGQALSYALESEPDSGLSINATTGLISGQIASPGVYTITVSADDGVTEPVSTTFAVTQEVAPEPVLGEIAPNPLPLSAEVGGVSEGAVRLENAGDAPLGYTITAGQDWLGASPDAGTIPAGQSASVEVGASCGTSAETRSGTLTVASDGGDASVAVTLVCSAAPAGVLGPVTTSPDPLTLSAEVLTDAQGGFVEFENVGDAPLSYTIVGSPSWLSASPDGDTLAPGQAARAAVTASCDATAGTRSGTLAVTGGEQTRTVTVTLECVAAATGPLLGPISPPSVDLEARVNDGADQFITFENQGDAPLTYTLDTDDDWVFASGGGTLAPGETGREEVGASCGSIAQTRAGSFTVESDGGSRTVPITIECTAVPVGRLSLTPLEATTLSAEVNAGASLSIELANTGDARVTYTLDSNRDWLRFESFETIVDFGGGGGAGGGGTIEPSVTQLGPQSLDTNERHVVALGAACGDAVEERSGTVTATGDSGDRLDLTVSLDCIAAPVGVLVVDPNELPLSTRFGDETTGRFEISNAGAAAVDYTITSSGSLLRVSVITLGARPGEASTGRPLGNGSEPVTIPPGGIHNVIVEASCIPDNGAGFENLEFLDIVGDNGDALRLLIPLSCSVD